MDAEVGVDIVAETLVLYRTFKILK